MQGPERERRRHAAVLDAHLDAHGAGIAAVEPCRPRRGVAEQEARRVVANRRHYGLTPRAYRTTFGGLRALAADVDGRPA